MIDDQTCDSNPHKVIIIDALSNNHFAFVVKNHSKNEPGKYVEATTLNKNDLIAIYKQKTIDERFSTFTHTLQTELNLMPLHQISQSSTLDTENNCPFYIDGVVKAIFEGYTLSQIQNWLNHKVEKNIKNPNGFFISKPIRVGETLYRKPWDEISKNFNLEVNLNNRSNVRYHVVFSVKWIKELGAFNLSVNPYLTYLDGIAYNYFKTHPIKIEQCLEDSLDKNLSVNISHTNFGNSTTQNSLICEKHYTQNDKNMITIKIDC